MLSEQQKLAREQMGQNPFAPIVDASNEYRNAHSLEYIALYLGQIESHLSTIAAELRAAGILKSKR